MFKDFRELPWFEKSWNMEKYGNMEIYGKMEWSSMFKERFKTYFNYVEIKKF